MIITHFGRRAEDDVSSEERTGYEVPFPTSFTGRPIESVHVHRVGTQLPEPWRTHPLAEALNEAEIALCRAIVEETHAVERAEAAAQEHEEAQAALLAVRGRRASAAQEMDDARAALITAMLDGEAP